MSTTKIKERLQTVVADLRDTLPPDKLPLANEVHDLFVVYRRECADLRRQSEEATSVANAATLRAKDAESRLVDAERKAKEAEEQLIRREIQLAEGPQDTLELAASLSQIAMQVIPYGKAMREEDPTNSWSDALMSLSAQLTGASLALSASEWLSNLNTDEVHEAGGFLSVDCKNWPPLKRVIVTNINLLLSDMASMEGRMCALIATVVTLKEQLDSQSRAEE